MRDLTCGAGAWLWPPPIEMPLVGVQGLPVTSMQWGAWAGAGMAAADATLSAKLQRAGLKLVTPLKGLSALGWHCDISRRLA